MTHWLDQTLQFLTVLLSASVLQSYKIDPETVPRSIVRRRDNAELQLVMSDEFSLEGRSFAKGDDDVFEAQQRPDDINQAISFCKFYSMMKAIQIAFSELFIFSGNELNHGICYKLEIRFQTTLVQSMFRQRMGV